MQFAHWARRTVGSATPTTCSNMSRYSLDAPRCETKRTVWAKNGGSRGILDTLELILASMSWWCEELCGSSETQTEWMVCKNEWMVRDVWMASATGCMVGLRPEETANVCGEGE
eukprot:1159066-Pelagomonas_calceolata.AAC.9